MKRHGDTPVLESDRLLFYRLAKHFASDAYLSWLNDTEVQKYTRRRNKTSTWQDMEAFLEYAESAVDIHLAMIVKANGAHIGNISLNSIDVQNQSAEISIMVGDRSVWGRGYACEAVGAVSEFGLVNRGLHRVWAESPNPAFNAIMVRLGWFQEGKKRDAILIDGVFMDLTCWCFLGK